MKKLILLAAVALTGCQHAVTASPSPAGAPAPSESAILKGSGIGAADASTAVTGFLKAAKAQDMQGMSSLFGGPNGLLREIETAPNVERRFLTMMCYLKHDSFAVTKDMASTGGSRVMDVQFTLGKVTRSSTFRAVPNAGGRWFVQEFDPEPLTALCAK